jgi:hypothetical protein
MGKVADVCRLVPGDWSIGNKDKGTVTEFQDLTGELGLNLKRLRKEIKGRHVAVEFGFETIFSDAPLNQNIVDTRRGDTVKFAAGPKKLTGTVKQISIHKAGKHARIVISEDSIKGI